MKKIFYLICFSCFFISTCFSQTANTDTCNENTRKDVTINYQNKYFLSKGINLEKYDWSNNSINCHINKAATELNKSRKNYLGGALLLPADLLFFLAGSSLLIVGIVDDERGPTIGGGITLATGVLTSGCTYLLFHSGKKHKKKHLQNLQIVSDYYLQNNLMKKE